MIVTEKEAAEKWCPHARVTEAGSGDGSSWNRLNSEPALDIHGTRCIGSACMSWRWIRTLVNDPAGGPNKIESTKTYGMCGLSGPPLDGAHQA